jgi:hypothetical protein
METANKTHCLYYISAKAWCMIEFSLQCKYLPSRDKCYRCVGTKAGILYAMGVLLLAAL